MVSWYHNSNDTVKPFFNFIEVIYDKSGTK